MLGMFLSHRRGQHESSDDESSDSEGEGEEADIGGNVCDSYEEEPEDEEELNHGDVVEDSEEEDNDNIDEEEGETEEYLKSLTVAILKDKLRERNLKVGGRKAELIDRLLGREESTKIISNIVCDMTEENLKQLKNAELQDLLKKRKMSTSGKKLVMVDRLLGREKGKAKKWKKSLGQSLLQRLINNERSKVHTMEADEIWNSEPIFQQYPFEKFEEYVTTLKAAAVKEKEIATINEEEIWKEILAYPRGYLTDRGLPFWDTHDAKSLLDEDVRDGTADRLKPKELRETRQPYREFPLDVFRPHIYQERRRQREEPGWVEIRNKIAQKIYENERNALSGEWDMKRKDNDLNDICKMWEHFQI